MLGFTKMNYGIFFTNLLISSYFLITGTVNTWSLISYISSISQVLSVILISNRDIRNYIPGFFYCLGYTAVSYYYGNTGAWVVNLFFYAPMQVIGYKMWKQNIKNPNKNTNIIKSKSLTTEQIRIVIGILFSVSIFFGLFSSLPIVQITLYNQLFDYHIIKYFVDAFTMIGSIVAMLLMIKQYKEHWYIWIMVNTMSIILWTITFNPIMIIMWISLLINAVYGLIMWKKDNA